LTHQPARRQREAIRQKVGRIVAESWLEFDVGAALL
jgi:hypothetical protein